MYTCTRRVIVMSFFIIILYIFYEYDDFQQNYMNFVNLHFRTRTSRMTEN